MAGSAGFGRGRASRLGGTSCASVGGLVQGPFPVPRDVRVHWQSQCHPTVTFQSERHHAQEPFGASAPSSFELGVPPDCLFPPLPRTVRAEQSSITTRLRRCPAGEGRGEGDSCSPRLVTPTRPLAHALLHTPPHPALSHRTLRGSAERYSERTRSVPGERDRKLSDVLKQPDDVYLGVERQSNP